MTTVADRARAVQEGKAFLRRLLDKTQTPRVPLAVREEARRALRHYPDDWDLLVAGGGVAADAGPADGGDAPVQYLLQLSPEQCDVLVRACDFYSRVGIGQFGEIASLARFGAIKHHHQDRVPPEHLEAAEDCLNQAKHLLTGLEANASFGIFNERVPDEYRAAWDLHRVIRQRLAWDRVGSPARRDWTGGKHMMGVSYDVPYQTGPYPLAKMERASDVDLMATLPEGFALSRKPVRGADDQTWHLFDMRGGAAVWVGSGESVRAMLALAQDSVSTRK